MASERAKAKSPTSLSGLLPFLRLYRGRMVFALALRGLIDGGLINGDTSAAGKGGQLMALRNHFFELLGVTAALAPAESCHP